MKLKELAEIKLGLEIPTHLLRREKKTDGTYFQCIRADDFLEGVSYFISQKDIRTVHGFSRKAFLFYGDYIVYKKENDFKIFRYDSPSGQTIPASGIIVISADLSIIKEFLGFEKNRKYFCDELKKIENTPQGLSKESIGEIDIWTDNVKELENSDMSDIIGIRKPINIKETPIRITQKSLSLDKLIKRIQHNELLLDTEFQRKPGLWSFPIKSRLIESLIIKLPIPAFYFDGSDDNEWLVIDGLQRLSAVNDFVNDVYPLEELDYLPELEGKTFSQLDRIQQRNIEEFEVFACIIEKETPISVKYKVFKNINTSALILRPQEIRHALNPGKPAQFLKEVAESEWFVKSVDISDTEKSRMLDRELVLRYIAFQISNYTQYKPPIVDFLDNTMHDLYDVFPNKLAYYKIELEDVIKTLLSALGESCFSRSLFEETRKPLHNNIMFELLTYGVSLLSRDTRSKIVQNSSEFRREIINHFTLKQNDEYFWEYESAYTIEGLRKRFEEIELLFKRLSQ